MATTTGTAVMATTEMATGTATIEDPGAWAPVRACWPRLMHVQLPVAGYPPGRPRHRLVNGMMLRRRELRSAFVELVGLVAVEPLFARLEATDDGMTGRPSVGAR